MALGNLGSTISSTGLCKSFEKVPHLLQFIYSVRNQKQLSFSNCIASPLVVFSYFLIVCLQLLYSQVALILIVTL